MRTRPQADAILEQRRLLDDPDPVPDLVSQVAQQLREALTAARVAYKAAHEEGMERLKNDTNWQQLTPEQKHQLLSEEFLTKVPDVNTATTDAVLASLRAMSLGTWADRTAALPTRFQRVLRKAAELMEPDAVYVKLESKTFKSREDIEAWVQELEELLLDKFDNSAGAVVVH